MPKREFIIDGDRFSTLDGFFDEVERVLIPGVAWGRNLDAFDDMLVGGFGTPEGGFVVRWRHSDRSRQALGYEETVRHLEGALRRCHPRSRTRLLDDIERARRAEGPTVFDYLLQILQKHAQGGQDVGGEVELFLE